MGGKITIMIYNSSQSPMLDLYSLSGDNSACGNKDSKPKAKFQKETDRFAKPEIDVNRSKTYTFQICPIPSVLFALLLPNVAQLGAVVILELIKHLEKPFNLRIEYEDGTTECVWFSLRVFNVNPCTFQPGVDIPNLTNMEAKHVVKCVVLFPTISLGDSISNGEVEITHFYPGANYDQDCRICMMKITQDQLNHMWTYQSDSHKNTMIMKFSDTKFSYVQALSQEMQNKAKRRMQKNRFMECVHQLMAALSLSINKVMQKITISIIVNNIMEQANAMLAEGMRQEKANKEAMDWYLQQAKKLYQATLLLRITDEEKKDIMNNIRGIDSKLNGNDFFVKGIKNEKLQNHLSTTAMKTKNRQHHLNAAKQADKTMKDYCGAFDSYKDTIKHDARLGHLEAVAKKNIEKQAEMGQMHRTLALNGFVPDLKLNKKQAAGLGWEGAQLLEIKGCSPQKMNKN